MQIENALQGRIQLNHFKHGRGDGESSPLPVKSGSIQSKISIVNEKAQGNLSFGYRVDTFYRRDLLENE